MQFFIDLQLDQKFKINKQTLCYWLCTLKNNYRNVHYHNWRHGLSVTQSMFYLISQTKLGTFISDIEKLGLLIACISHDVDHRGYNNKFYTIIDSPLAHLYSTSTLECHHFDQCILILNMKGCNILENLSLVDVASVIKIIEFSILATDLMNYLKGIFFKYVKENSVLETGWKNNPNKFKLLMSMMMSMADLFAVAKPWDIHYKLSAFISEEFYQQGDIEISQLKQLPLSLMDRKQSNNLPQMQIDFIDAIAYPLFQNMAKICPELENLVKNIENNKREWTNLIGKFNYNTYKQEFIINSNKNERKNNSKINKNL